MRMTMYRRTIMDIHELQAGKRATGRTSRMVDEAISLAKQHRAVYIISRDWLSLQHEISQRMPNSGIKCEAILPRGFDWRTMRGPGAHPNCVWLVDHHFIESDDTFRAMLEQMTRFDGSLVVG